jgi:tRNA/rRNA methyltransferase
VPRFFSDNAAMTEQTAHIAIVLARPSHPGNIGAAARAMKTMGFADLRLVAPRRFPHPEADALASGAVDVLERARVYPSLAEALGDVSLAVGFSARSRELSHAAVALREAAPRIHEGALAAGAALVFGNETFGLTNEELGRCQMLCSIPASPEYASLNLAAAVQVACYELSLAASMPGSAKARDRQAATVEDIEALFAHWEDTMVESGFHDPAEPKRLMERMRRLFARTRLEREEVRFLRGMLAAYEARMKR